MAAKNTAQILSALSDDDSIRIFELLSDGDMSTGQLIEKTGLSRERIEECTGKMEECGLVISTKDDDEMIYFLDAKQVALITGFFELILNKCSPPKCC